MSASQLEGWDFDPRPLTELNFRSASWGKAFTSTAPASTIQASACCQWWSPKLGKKEKNSQTPTLEVTTAIVENNVLGAQAHFSTTQQLFLSSSEPKKTTCGISKYIFFIVKYIFTAFFLM